MRKKHGRTTRTSKKGSGYLRPPLGPLSSQLARVKLLCLSYPDAVTAVTLRAEGRARLSVSTPWHNADMWPFGSYSRLEDQFEALRVHSQEVEQHRLWYRNFWRVYVSDAENHLENRYSARVLAEAHAGLRRVAKGMGTKVYVPIEVSEANGFNPDDAQAFTRRALDQAA